MWSLHLFMANGSLCQLGSSSKIRWVLHRNETSGGSDLWTLYRLTSVLQQLGSVPPIRCGWTWLDLPLMPFFWHTKLLDISLRSFAKYALVLRIALCPCVALCPRIRIEHKFVYPRKVQVCVRRLLKPNVPRLCANSAASLVRLRCELER